ncbi:hypothetical protein ACFLS1_01140 [Verrucomicrobiota bacterium]
MSRRKYDLEDRLLEYMASVLPGTTTFEKTRSMAADMHSATSMLEVQCSMFDVRYPGIGVLQQSAIITNQSSNS